MAGRITLALSVPVKRVVSSHYVEMFEGLCESRIYFFFEKKKNSNETFSVANSRFLTKPLKKSEPPVCARQANYGFHRFLHRIS